MEILVTFNTKRIIFFHFVCLWFIEQLLTNRKEKKNTEKSSSLYCSQFVLTNVLKIAHCSGKIVET